MANRIMLNETSYHGAGAILEIATEAKAHGFQKAFVCSDPDLIKFGVTKKVTDVLDKNGLVYEIYSDIKPNPTIQNVQHGVQAFKDSGADYLIAIGGGSSMDTSKAIGIIIANPEFEDVRSLEGVAPTKKPCVPIIAVPTTAGTAAEVTINYVITDVEKKRKFVCVDPHDMPIIAIVDPEMMSSMPKGLTASTGMDALTHAMEAFLNLFASRSVQNASIEAVCENFHALPEVWRDGTHLAARQEMLHASYLAGFAFTNNFVGYVHAIAHAVGALYHIPHGRANAVLLPAVLREYGSCIAPKLAVLADALSLGGDTVSEKAERMIAAIEAMRDSFDIPSTLPHLSPNDYTEIARRALKEANPTYPVPQIWDSEKIFSVLRRVQS